MRYAVIRGYRMAGPLYDYAFGEFSHETPKKIATKEPVHHRNFHDKFDVICLCETREQAQRIVDGFAIMKAEYLRRVQEADQAYEAAAAAHIERARAEAEQLSLEVEQAMKPRRRRPRRARAFEPVIVGGTDAAP